MRRLLSNETKTDMQRVMVGRWRPIWFVLIGALMFCTACTEQRDMYITQIGHSIFRTYETRGSTFSDYGYMAIEKRTFVLGETLICVPEVDSLSITQIKDDSVRVDIYLLWQKCDLNSARIQPNGRRKSIGMDKIGYPEYVVIKSIRARLSDFDTLPNPYNVSNPTIADSTGRLVPLDSLCGCQASDRRFHVLAISRGYR